MFYMHLQDRWHESGCLPSYQWKDGHRVRLSWVLQHGDPSNTSNLQLVSNGIIPPAYPAAATVDTWNFGPAAAENAAFEAAACRFAGPCPMSTGRRSDPVQR